MITSITDTATATTAEADAQAPAPNPGGGRPKRGNTYAEVQADAEGLLQYAIDHPDAFRSIVRQSYSDAFGNANVTRRLARNKLREALLHTKALNSDRVSPDGEGED